MTGFYRLLGVTTPFDPSNRFTTSYLLPTFVFALLRLLLSLYAFVTIFYILAWDSTHGRKVDARHWFSYFTNLTYFGLAFYFLFAGLHSLSLAVRGKSWPNSWPRPLQAAHSIFYTTVVTYPPLVTIVFWAILYKGPWYTVTREAWSNISQHALNSLYALVEIFLPRTEPPPLLHLPFLILILALYLGLAYICRATEGFYVYDFLDPAKGKGRVAGYVFAILAGIIIIYGIVYGVITLRNLVFRKIGLDHDRGGAIERRKKRQQEDGIRLEEDVK